MSKKETLIHTNPENNRENFDSLSNDTQCLDEISNNNLTEIIVNDITHEIRVNKKGVKQVRKKGTKSWRECCIGEGCKTRPTYNKEGKTNALFCTLHKEKGMVDVIHKICEEEECEIRANFNFKGKKKPLFCATHGKEKGMVDVKSKKCEEEECEIRATFNFKGEKKPLLCALHGKEKGMVDVKSKKCEEEECEIHATFNFKGEKKPLFCATHGKKKGMVDVKSKICEEEECEIRAAFNFKGEKKPLLCALHGKEKGMVDVVSSFCEHKIEKKHCKKCDPNGYLTSIIRSRVRSALKNFSPNKPKNRHTMEYVGCTIETLRKHLEEQLEDGMTWENQGEWHIDHRKPCASFNLDDEKERDMCFHYTNLQPMWGPENISKGASFDEETFDYTWNEDENKWDKN